MGMINENQALYFQIKQIPDLSLHKYQTLSDTGVDGLLKRHQNFLRQWYGICSISSVSMHMLMLMNKKRIRGERLEIYLAFGGGEQGLKEIEPLLYRSPLCDYFEFEKVEGFPGGTYKAAAVLIKNECMAEVEMNCRDGYKNVFYVPHWEMNQDARMYDTYRTLETVAESYSGNDGCAFRIDIYPVNLEKKFRRALAPVMHELRGENEVILTESTKQHSADGYANEILKDCEQWLTTLETSPHFRVNMYAFADTQFQAQVILTAAGAEAVEKGNYGIFPIKRNGDLMFSVFERFGEVRSYCRFANATQLVEWSTTFSLEEVEAFFRFPALFEGESIEIPKETSVLSNEGEIFLGKDDNGYDVRYSLKQLPKHAFFSGTPGSGKTNTMLHLVTELQKMKIPFLILEPAKKEYRALFNRKEMNNIRLFSPHLKSMFPLRINPFEFPKGVQLSEHISGLLEVFQGSFVLEGPTYKFLSSSIQRAYENLGWDIEEINTGDFPFPTLNDIYLLLEEEIEKSSYDSEIKGNVRSFLQVRLGGLMERDAGEMFNCIYSSLSPEEWLYCSAIIELEVLNEQAKNFAVLLLCHYIDETLKINPKENSQMPVRHVLFLEEAHNLIAQTTQQGSADNVDPKISATAYIVKMLAEVRARREAIVIADQLPTALAAEVTKNTGLKLVHRLTAKDDRDTIGAAISATEFQLEQLLTFRNGQGLIFHEYTQKPFRIQINKWAIQDEEYLSMDDSILAAILAGTQWYKSNTQIVISNYYERVMCPAYKTAKEKWKIGNAYYAWKKERGSIEETVLEVWINTQGISRQDALKIKKKITWMKNCYGAMVSTDCLKLTEEILRLIEENDMLEKTLKKDIEWFENKKLFGLGYT